MKEQSDKITSQQLQDRLKEVVTDVTPREDKNLYIIKTAKGKIRIWSELEPKEFYKSINLKKKY